jgi:hypothetical protein
MNLAITVVFLVTEGNEQLLDLHLDQIKKHTTVPYHIYASCNRLPPTLQQMVRNDPSITICDIPETGARLGSEHSYYQEELIRRAANDGASHICTMHVDSFPIKMGWAREFADRLSDDCPVVTIPGRWTACMFFSTAFFRDSCPTLRLPEKTLESSQYLSFSESFPHIPHTGIGYLYSIHLAGKRVHFLQSTNDRIFGDCMYHFGGAMHHFVGRLDQRTSLKRNRHRVENGLIWVGIRARRFLPQFASDLITYNRYRRKLRSEMTFLLDDFDAYMSGLSKNYHG